MIWYMRWTYAYGCVHLCLCFYIMDICLCLCAYDMDIFLCLYAYDMIDVIQIFTMNGSNVK